MQRTVAYFKENYGWQAEKTIANVIQPKYFTNPFRRKTEFDPLSIMMYPIPKDLLDPRDLQYEKWRATIADNIPPELSQNDVKLFQEFYGHNPDNNNTTSHS